MSQPSPQYGQGFEKCPGPQPCKSVQVPGYEVRLFHSLCGNSYIPKF